MAEWGYEDAWGAGAPYDDWSDYMSGDAYQSFAGWGDPTGPGSSGDTGFSGEGTGWGSSILGALGAVGGFLGQNAGTLGPLLSGAGSIAGGAIGSQAAQDAARLQADALNRGIDLQTAQWLQQQGNLAPYLQAGQQGLSQLQQLAGREQPGMPGATPAVSGANYALPPATPGWTPQMYQGPQSPDAGAYRWTPGQVPSAAANRWTPGQGPRAQDYRYTPGATPDAAHYRSAQNLYQGPMPGTQVSTLTGQQVLDQDPGAAFRQSEARKALEGSAAARGDLLSGGTLQALQSRSQDLASQEYGNAWQRMMARDTEQYGRNWGQYQQAWNQGVQGSQIGMQVNAQNFGQAMSASQLRESVNQQAQQMGWNQAQAEAVFREQMAQQASAQGFGQQMSETQLREQMNQQANAQNWGQALAGQGQAWQQGLAGQQWNQRQQQQYETDMYTRMLEQTRLRYGQDVNQNQTDYERQQAAYRQQLAQHLLPFEQQSTLANLGGQAVGMYGSQGGQASRGISDLLAQLGSAQGMGAAGSGLAWNRALGGATNQLPSLLAGLNA